MWRSVGSGGGDSLCKGGCCNSFRSAIVKVVGGGGVGGCGGGGSGDGVGGDDGGWGFGQITYEPTQPTNKQPLYKC